ncbi:MAG: thiamine phosphate synthase [Sulfuricaulis sp.]|uniref:thiamine phosphate synthase n=1 Tax=Sulfuricaulis sp. TaxID=2003553 RepID=UPI0025F4ACF8|nr:thiamine phosphate synthase [Sulfuricaulis sp.]MCR4347852.1 thiamine phosphate synthase [Sulfuricaulis sp.]
MVNKSRIAGLYAIADTQYLDDARLLPAVGKAIAGGARVIQYRDKQHVADSRLGQAKEIAKLCRQHGALFIINDDLDLALKTQADGVHLGREDAALAKARERLGPRTIIGVSCYNELARAETAQAQGADYIAFGRFFPSRTKPQAVQASLDLLREAKKKLRIPVVAIGGITPENGAALIAAGADALAVIEGVFGQPDIRAAAERYARLFNN